MNMVKTPRTDQQITSLAASPPFRFSLAAILARVPELFIVATSQLSASSHGLHIR